MDHSLGCRASCRLLASDWKRLFELPGCSFQLNFLELDLPCKNGVHKPTPKESLTTSWPRESSHTPLDSEKCKSLREHDKINGSVRLHQWNFYATFFTSKNTYILHPSPTSSSTRCKKTSNRQQSVILQQQ